MELIVNELSLEGQYANVESFVDGLDVLMQLRSVARNHGRSVSCDKSMLHSKITKEMILPQVLSRLGINKRRALTSWLTRGPFWEDSRKHSSTDVIELEDDIVTDYGLGEAAFRNAKYSEDCQMVSFSPSSWDKEKLIGSLETGDSTYETQVDNHTSVESLDNKLRTSPVNIDSWAVLEEVSRGRSVTLVFSEDAFSHLSPSPFVKSAANRIHELLGVLDFFAQSFDDNGSRTELGNSLYNQHFTGDKAWFSDSSGSEKKDFKEELTFQNPKDPDKTISCTWHGKVNNPKFRVHFSWRSRYNFCCRHLKITA